MKLIFDKDSNGTQELVDALGLIDARTDFSKWKPYIPLSVRRLSAIRIDACRLVEVENLVINLLPYDGTQATYA